jgi:hypothetical protein
MRPLACKTDGKTGLGYLWAMAADHPVAAAALFCGVVVAFALASQSDNNQAPPSAPQALYAPNVRQVPLGTSEDEARRRLGPPLDAGRRTRSRPKPREPGGFAAKSRAATTPSSARATNDCATSTIRAA